MDRLVAAFAAADRVGAADIGRPGLEAIVLALAIGTPIGWIGGR